MYKPLTAVVWCVYAIKIVMDLFCGVIIFFDKKLTRNILCKKAQGSKLPVCSFVIFFYLAGTFFFSAFIIAS